MKRLVVFLLSVLMLALPSMASTTQTPGTPVVYFDLTDAADIKLINTNFLYVIWRLDSIYSNASKQLSTNLCLWGSNRVVNSAEPVNPQDLATMHYVTNRLQTGIPWGSFYLYSDGGNDKMLLKTDSSGLSLRNYNDTTYANLILRNITITGTQTVSNLDTLNLATNNIWMNYGVAGAPTEDATIYAIRGTSTNAVFRWDESNDKWVIGLVTNLQDVLVWYIDDAGNLATWGQQRNIVPRSPNTGSLGINATNWGNAYISNGYFYGNLQLNGSNVLVSFTELETLYTNWRDTNAWIKVNTGDWAGTFGGQSTNHYQNWLYITNHPGVTEVGNMIPLANVATNGAGATYGWILISDGATNVQAYPNLIITNVVDKTAIIGVPRLYQGSNWLSSGSDFFVGQYGTLQTSGIARVLIGHTNLNSGVGSCTYGFANTNLSPYLDYAFSPRNNADTVGTNIGQIVFEKNTNSDACDFYLALANGTSGTRTKLMIFSGATGVGSVGVFRANCLTDTVIDASCTMPVATTNANLAKILTNGNNAANQSVTNVNVLNAQQVGVGILSPAMPLDVNGAAWIRGSSITVGNNTNAASSAGEIRFTNGSALGWRNIGGDANLSFGFGDIDQAEIAAQQTITNNVTDGLAGALRFDQWYDSTVTGRTVVTSFFDLLDPIPGGANPPTILDANVFRFNKVVGTHKSLDSSTMMGDGWMKLLVKGTNYYTPISTSKVAWAKVFVAAGLSNTPIDVSCTLPSSVVTQGGTTANAAYQGYTNGANWTNWQTQSLPPLTNSVTNAILKADIAQVGVNGLSNLLATAWYTNAPGSSCTVDSVNGQYQLWSPGAVATAYPGVLTKTVLLVVRTTDTYSWHTNANNFAASGVYQTNTAFGTDWFYEYRPDGTNRIRSLNP